MNRTHNWLVHEHSLYENLLFRCQDAAEVEEWRAVDLAFSESVTHLRRQMAVEEEVLYPAYESAPDAPQGPTTALREAHSDIVRPVHGVARVIKARGSEHVLECRAHLEKQMIRHHEKEAGYLPAHGESFSECHP
jgi:hypothetical protein